MKYEFAVIGANGIQGRIAARDLLESGRSVLLCAENDFKLDHLIEHGNSDFALVDLRRPDKMKRIIRKSGADVVINCAFDDYNPDVLKICLDLGIHYIDLGSSGGATREQLSFDATCKEKGLTAITGCGSTPGITNVMLRHAEPQFDTIHTVYAGFTWNANMPKFVVPFSLEALFWELTDTATILKDGQFMEHPPTEAPFDYYFKGIGRQKAYYVDHDEVHTFYQFLQAKRVKNIAFFASHPPHIDRALRLFLETDLIHPGKTSWTSEKIRSVDFVNEIIRSKDIPQGYEEKENLWVKIWGMQNGKKKTVEMDCMAGTLFGWEEDTCNIDTGMPASIVAQMIYDGRINERGSFAPEFVVPPEAFFAELGQRKIIVYENGVCVNPPRPRNLTLEKLPQLTVRT